MMSILKLIVSVVILGLTVEASTAQMRNAWLNKHGFHVELVQVCDAYKYQIYKIDGFLKTHEVVAKGDAFCGRIYSFRTNKDEDIFIYGVIFEKRRIGKEIYFLYANSLVEKFAQSSEFNLSIIEHEGLDRGGRDVFLIKSKRGAPKEEWGVLDIEFQDVGGGTAVVARLGPYSAWTFGEEFSVDKDFLAGIKMAKKALEEWFRGNEYLIRSQW